MNNFKPATFIKRLIPFEKIVWQQHTKLKINKPFVVSISGTSGTGKTTLAKNIYKYFKDRYKKSRVTLKESGKIYRNIAKKYGFADDLIRFSRKVSSKNMKIDELVDKTMLSYSYNLRYSKGKFRKLNYKYMIAVGRLANLVCGKNAKLRIFLIADVNEIAKRLSKDKKREEYGLPVDTIKNSIVKRDMEDLKRYEKVYGIKNYILESMKTSNVVIDTTYLSKKETLGITKKYIDFAIKGKISRMVGKKNAKKILKKMYLHIL
ncbi:MAG: cytidylate kinase family protein [Candidatus Aenigmarchaeota archaeon]|nr:cytidylate kinase family protein [Candidatus Aenigmarchaeota archaeon]